MSSPVDVLYKPIKVGKMDLQHRIVMSAMTRLRANKDHVHGELAKTFYSQRATIPGTLLITEATFIAAQAGGYDNVPGIYNKEQIAAWKAVTDAVHAKGSYICCQLWSLGRTAQSEVLKRDGYDFVAPSPIPLSGGGPHPSEEAAIPRELTKAEIKEYVQLHAKAASNAMEAGFDCVELHFANGYLTDQFLQPCSNKRTDEYGGSVENRIRYPLEVVDAVVEAIGAERTALRCSPHSKFQDMGMDDPIPTFGALLERVRAKHPNFAYCNVIQARVDGIADAELTDKNRDQTTDPLRKILGDIPFIAAGGMTRDTAASTVEKYGGMISFARNFISNPDLPRRIKENLPLTPYNRETFYTAESAIGYIDYPFADEVVAQA